MEINFKEVQIPIPNIENCGEYRNRLFEHVCEVCGKREVLLPEKGFLAGWDHAPYMYPFKVLSPRTCNDCSIEDTVYWQIAGRQKTFSDLTDNQKKTLERIYNDPDSILIKE